MDGKRISPQLALICGLVGTAMWTAAHIAMHGPRGWPCWELGEWDVMLVAEALLAGERVDLGVGAIHGHELGSYLIALVVIPLRWAGLSSLLAAKTVATGIGALSTGLAVAGAAWLGGQRGGRIPAVLAAAVVAVLASVAWPSWHRELGGLFGRTPESVLPQVAAGLLLLRWPPPGLGRLGLGGLLLGIAWLFSPASIWMLGLGVLVALAPGGAVLPSRLGRLSFLPPRLRRLLFLLLCIGLPAFLTALLLPGGLEGVEAFLGKQVNQTAEALGGHTGTHPLSTGERGPLKAFLAGPAVFGHVQGGLPHTLARWALGSLGWLLVAVCGFGLASSLKRRRLSTEGVLVLAALSFVVPLGLVATDSGDLGNAARYYVVPIYFGLVAAASWIGGLAAWKPRFGWLPAAGLLVLAALPLGSLGSMMQAPAWTLEQSLVNTGAHGLPQIHGASRHKAFMTLLPGAPAAGRRSFIEGYGLDLGGEAAVQLWDRSAVDRSWGSLLPVLTPEERSALLVGTGCGLSRIDVDDDVLRFLAGLPSEQQPDLGYGLGLCVFDEGRTHPTRFLASDEVLGGLPEPLRSHLEEGRRDAARPHPREARRSTVASPAERMRALPPRGPRPEPR